MSLYRANLSVKGMRVGEIVDIEDEDLAARWFAKGWIAPHEPYDYVAPVVVEVDHPAIMHALLDVPVDEPKPKSTRRAKVDEPDVGEPLYRQEVGGDVVEGDGSGEALPPLDSGD